MTYLLPICFLALVAGSAFVVFRYFDSIKNSGSQLAESLSAIGFHLVTSKFSLFDTGPFHSAGAYHQPVYRISATDSNGKLYHGWARWSTDPGHFDFSWEQS